MHEVYASACYDVTQYHLSKIDTFETIEEIELYDYMEGYPEKLKFEDSKESDEGESDEQNIE